MAKLMNIGIGIQILFIDYNMSSVLFRFSCEETFEPVISRTVGWFLNGSVFQACYSNKKCLLEKPDRQILYLVFLHFFGRTHQ